MGTTPSAFLAYGYALGSNEEGWNVQESIQYDRWIPHWQDINRADEDAVDLADPTDGLMEQILVSTGLVDREYAYPYWSDDARDKFNAAKKQAEKQAGVDVIFHGYDSSLQYALVAFHVEAEWGSVEVIDFAALNQRRQAEDWDGKLTRACQALRITPVVPKSGHYDYEPARLREPIQPQFLLLARYF